ncbi:LpxI family protein [Sulfitobacter sp. S190]|uniref:LpxI family protein n=1 Tax=Sulfitobacter sp. S190 TaxID=2867022 RepID=UPI0021A606E7|nr:UDP-2,3-diacylglucosamine diphosphatase LpxI [Sulfitobacter sp. S190]UWR20883.1 UDP-2,3-diacylglucosamine diphosphatase LpxI [Sulfitobacter sp. S190]
MTLALIAGRGDLPALVASALQEQPIVCGYEGIDVTGVDVDLTFRLETLGSLLLALGERGVTEVCFAGGLDRPALDPIKLDAETAPLVPMFMQALELGDDGALRVVLQLFEKTGFSVRGAHELAPDLVAKGGVYSDQWPDAGMRADAEIAAQHILDQSPRDVGQACVVGGERVLAMETASGTDKMLSGLPGAAREARAILFKGPKKGQTMKIDMPTIGPETLDAAAAAGLAGVVVDAGDVLVLHADQCAARADAHGLVLWARTGE